ncbi:MAG: lipocalin, partial [Betaproteobacteria bacterium]
MLCLATFSAAAAEAVAVPVTTIAALDVARYMGTWYEIAKYPNRFQRNCVADTQADYRLLDDGTVQVTNRCRMQGGDINEAQGVARQVG